MLKKFVNKIDYFFSKIDELPLWLIGVVIEVIVFIPYVKMGHMSVFPWHDQLDENLLTYVLTARHWGEKLTIIPEMMGGLNASSLQPFAILFEPLYLLFDTFTAFVIQYAIVFAVAFFGMYFCVREITGSNILSCIVASVFSMLPFWPVYGCAVAGIPMAVLAILWLERRKKPIASFALLSLFCLSSHLAHTGYGVLAFWFIWIIYSVSAKKCSRLSVIGFCYTIFLYVIINIDLFREMLFGEKGYVTNRMEFLNSSLPFSDTFKYFLNGGQHDQSFHKYLIIPIIALLILGLVLRKKLTDNKKRALAFGIIGFISLVLIALWRAFLKSRIVTEWLNSQDNVLRHFSMERFLWMAPALWLIEFALCIYIFWSSKKNVLLQIVIVCVLIFPTAKDTIYNSYFYMSINQMNNGTAVTGYIPWDSYYSEDVMGKIDKEIGKDMTSYRVAHIGMNPTPALMHGFYTIDGNAGTYPLEYKHKFRKIIEKEFEKSPEIAYYFDHWGSRCYLFNSQCGNYFMLGKSADAVFTSLDFDWELLKEMGCEYIFSGGELSEYKDDGLEFVGSFTSDTSYWNVWVYRIP